MARQNIARVVVACHAAGEIGPAIGAGLRLAARWRAKLHVAFLQDPQLHRLIGHPLARHVGFSRTAVAALEAAEMETLLFATAGRARAELAAKAARQGLDWSFAVIRETATEAALGAQDDDFLVVEACARAFAGYWRLRSCFSALAMGANLPVLMVRPRQQPRRVVAAIFGPENPSLMRAVASAADMAATSRVPLTVLTGPEAPPAKRIRELLEAGGLVVGIEVAVEAIAGASALRGTHAHFLQGALLVLDATSRSPGLDDLEALAEQADCDVLLVR